MSTVRAVYLAEIEALARRLRTRIESGELHGHRARDFKGFDSAAPALRGRRAPPQLRLENLCRRTLIRDCAAAFRVLAASPHAADLDGAIVDLAAAPYAAAECAAYDVLAFARARGWYMPEPGEYVRPGVRIEAGAWA